MCSPCESNHKPEKAIYTIKHETTHQCVEVMVLIESAGACCFPKQLNSKKKGNKNNDRRSFGDRGWPKPEGEAKDSSKRRVKMPSRVEPHRITLVKHANETHATCQACSHLFYGLNRKFFLFYLFY